MTRLLKNKTILTLLITGFGLLLTAGVVFAGTHTFNAGVKDNFDTSDGTEPATPSNSLLASSHGCVGQPPINFDVVPLDRCFGHTFENLPGAITKAELTIRMKAKDFSFIDTFKCGIGTCTDHFHLELSKGMDRWGVSMNTLIASSTNGSQLFWTSGSKHTFELDLDNLPPGGPNNATSVIDSMNDTHSLDVWLDDDTGVDYMELTVCNGKGHDKGKGKGHHDHGQGKGLGHCKTKTVGQPGAPDEPRKPKKPENPGGDKDRRQPEHPRIEPILGN